MKQIIWAIFGIFIFILITLSIFSFFFPSQLKVTSTKQVNAPIEMVYNEFNELKNFTSWIAWVNNDSLMDITYYSPDYGKGATMTWKTSKNITENQLKIINSQKNKSIEYEIILEKKGVNLSQVKLSSTKDKKTNITWTLEGENTPFFMRIFNWIGIRPAQKELEKSLAALQEKLESKIVLKNPKNLKSGQVYNENFEGMKILSTPLELPINSPLINTKINSALDNIADILIKDSIKIPNRVIFVESYDTKNNLVKMYVGYPINQNIEVGKNMIIKSIPATKALFTLYRGKNDESQTSLTQINNYAKEKSLKLSPSYWQIYLKPIDTLGNTEKKIYKAIQN